MATLQVLKRLDEKPASVSPRKGETKDDDGLELSAICVIGEKLSQDADLIRDIKSFGYPLKVSR